MTAISQREYARHRHALGLSGGDPRSVRNAIADGRLLRSVTRAKKIRSASDADEEWDATTKAEHVPLTGPTAPSPSPRDQRTNPLAVARARREAAQAELREMELAQRRGELVSAKEIEAELANAFSQCRDRLLSIPSRMRQRDASMSGLQLVLLETLIRDALEDLAAPQDSDVRRQK